MERLRILLRPAQAARLHDAARVNGVSVTELPQEAIEQEFPHPSAAQRRAGWVRFNALPSVTPEPDPGTLEALLDDRVDKLLPPG